MDLVSFVDQAGVAESERGDWKMGTLILFCVVVFLSTGLRAVSRGAVD